jgi:predicted ferric reductase
MNPARLLIGYLLVICSPLLVLSLVAPETFFPLTYDLGRHFGLMGFAILAMQVVLAARLKCIDRAFGLNNVFSFHRNMGLLAGCLLLLHPVLLALGSGRWTLLYTLELPWYVWLGRLALIMLLLNLIMAAGRDRFGLKFETWRLGHDISGPLILAAAFGHSWFTGGDLYARPLQILWLAFLGLAAGLFAYHRLLRPARLKRRPHRVIEVKQEADRVWTLKFAPPRGEPRFDFLPGQWQFVTLLRGRGLQVEEHHFTISSSPAEKDFHTSTIKELGDFTSTIGQTRPGNLAVLHGPFGIFSHTRHPERRNLVYIAGGIGITPFMSNLRHMRDTGAEKRVLLLYANRHEGDIAFREELAEMEAGVQPELRVVHILSRPEENWPGERGRLDRDKLKRLCGDRLEQATFLIAGPPGLVQGVVADLRGLGVDYSRLSVELFAF